MNKLFRNLVSVSLVLLGLAMCGGLWLVWQTLAESRALERQNRELQASLEASRIRVENFCEYPSDVLCRVDERSGIVAGALPRALPGLEELAGVPEPQKKAISAEGSSSASPAKALENVKKVAQAQSAFSASAAMKTAPVQNVAVPASVTSESALAKAPASAPASVKSTAEKADKVHTPAVKAASPAASSKEKEKVTPAKQESVKTPAPAVKKADQILVEKATKTAETTSVKAEAAPATPANTSYTQEISGKLSDTVISNSAKNTEKASQRPAKALLKNQKEVRQSWSRIDQDGDIFVFTITGAGDQLKASGNLRTSPWRYELVLDGLFTVRPHSIIANRLVKSISTKTWKGKTILVFQLKGKPYKCSIHKTDRRTVSLRIR